MLGLSMAEGGSHYCSKKKDDICGDGCDKVWFMAGFSHIFLLIFMRLLELIFCHNLYCWL
ncbi:unnamed protein product [Camellia sinensis]